MRPKKGQSVLEYTVLLIIVMAAFVATSQYLKRGIQGRWKESVDELGDQYDPTVMATNLRYTLRANATTEMSTQPDAAGGWTQRIDSSNSIETKTGEGRADSY